MTTASGPSTHRCCAWAAGADTASVRGRALVGSVPLLVPLIFLVCAVAFAMLARLALRDAPVGYTSGWHVPTSTIYHGLRYSLAKPVECQPRSAVEQSYGRLQPLPSDLGFPRFTADAPDQPVFLWLAPKGRSCLVLYAQYQQVG
jgi:hypothetical protein